MALLRRLLSGLGALLLSAGWACAAFGLLMELQGVGVEDQNDGPLLIAGLGIPLVIAGILLFPRPERRRPALEILVLGALPLWGALINHRLPACDGCAQQNAFLAEPWAWALYGAHGLGALAYLILRRRPELPPATEAWLLGALAGGIALMLPLILHFGGEAIAGLIFAPIGLPLMAPVGVLLLYGLELWRRLRRRGLEAQAGAGGLAVLLRSPALVGVWALAEKALQSPRLGAAFLEACTGTLAQNLPPPADCHYLCTVAATGHPALVRPLRLGTRRGRIILVNRQLCVANAFEDLLHERWPRFGAWSRRTYDRVGRPISHLIAHPLAADLVFLAMKPAEWLFYLALLLWDPADPEHRIGRMYPAPAGE